MAIGHDRDADQHRGRPATTIARIVDLAVAVRFDHGHLELAGQKQDGAHAEQHPGDEIQ